MLTDTIKNDLATAMKAGEALRVSTLRMLLSEMNYRKIDLGRDLTDEDITGVIGREVKKRREAIESFRSGGREEQAAQEEQELGILQSYLPQQLTEEEIRKELQGMSEVTRGADFGQVMKAVSPRFRGRADGGTVARIVREMLA